MSRSYTMKEAASFLGVSYRTMRRYLKNGLSYTEVRGDKGIEYRLTESDLFKFKKFRLERPRQGAKLGDIFAYSDARTERTNQDGAEGADGSDKKLIEILESENAFLKEQIASKDKQLADYHAIIKKLTHQNEVLTMMSQGVEPKGDGAEQHNPVSPAEQEEEDCIMQEEKASLTKAEIIAETKRLHKAGKSAEEIRQFVARYGYNSFSDLLQKP